MIQETVHVALAQTPYDVVVGDGHLELLAEALPALGLGGKCVVLTDSNVAPLYLDQLLHSLGNAGFTTTTVTVPAGEESKSMTQAEACCREMIRDGHDRSSFLIALGGGVVGDLAGFVASIFYRGIPYLQVPTTIVSQVDSSVGGKTGVNAPEGKNLIGAFHQPRLVWADIATLSSLPDREYREGFAEIIKHAAIRDAAMFDLIAEVREDRTRLAELVARNVSIKARVVEEDERETRGTRALLNFGHTIGHGIESAAGYGRYLHGEAIGLGLRAAARISVKKGKLSAGDAAALEAQIDAFKLPTHLPEDITEQAVLDALATDKKFKAGAIHFVLLEGLGKASVSQDVSLDDIKQAITGLRTV